MMKKVSYSLIHNLNQIIAEKDAKIEEQKAEINSLRKKNFEFRSKNQELSDKLKQSEDGQNKKQKIDKIDEMHQHMMAI